MHGYRREIVLRSWSRWLLLNQLLPCSHFCHYILVLLLCTMNFTLQFYAGTSSYWKCSCLLNARDTIIHRVLIKLSLVSSFVTLPLTKHLPSDRSVQATAYTYSVNWCNLSNRLDGQFAGYTQHSTTTTDRILEINHRYITELLMGEIKSWWGHSMGPRCKELAEWFYATLKQTLEDTNTSIFLLILQT